MTNSSLLTALLERFVPDEHDRPAVALRVDIAENDAEQPVHSHRKCQLVFALKGGVTCAVPKAIWMVPPLHAVWLPSGMPHSNRATKNAQMYFLYIDPGVISMPDKCCTLAISPLLRELIQYLADQDPYYSLEGPTARLATVLLEQLVTAPVEELHLPISDHPKVRLIADALEEDPADRSTMASWASRMAMSERSLARLVLRETGLTFGRWRQQLHLIVALRQLSEGVAVQRVAGNLGYDSVTAFITMFKKALGKPPGQYFSALQ